MLKKKLKNFTSKKNINVRQPFIMELSDDNGKNQKKIHARENAKKKN